MKFNSSFAQKANKVLSTFVTISMIGMYANVPTLIAYAETLSPSTTPTITLKGANPLVLHVGDTYVPDYHTGGADFDATAGTDGDWITNAYLTGGNAGFGWGIDTSAPTTVYLTYSISEQNPVDPHETLGQASTTRTIIITDEPVVPPTPITITSVTPINIDVDFGTATSSIPLPSNVSVSLSNGSTLDLPITNINYGVYDGNLPNTYVLRGTINLTGHSSVENPGEYNATVNVTVHSAPLVCTIATSTVFSDSSTLINGNESTSTYNMHEAWTASIPGATWIWSDAQVQHPLTDETTTFTKTFTVSGSVDSAQLDIAADNTFIVYLNGQLVGGNYNGYNYASADQKTYTVNPSLFVNGTNILTFTIKNLALPWSDYTKNPAGLLYKFAYSASTCGKNPGNTSAPTITLIGANPLYITFGGDTTDPGATATDTDGNDISSLIVRTGGNDSSNSYIDHWFVGTTTLLYVVTDSHNLSTSTTREVVVLPEATTTIVEIAPTITLNGSNPTNVIIGATFTDLGAEATTTATGHTLSLVVTGGTNGHGGVDTSSATTTIIVYTVTDTTNGLSASTSRAVVVADASGPSNTTGTGGNPVVTTTSFSGGGGGGGGSPSFLSLGAPNAANLASCPFLFTYMKLGANNDSSEVAKLQSFLRTTEGLSVDVTGTFDQRTFDAVSAFQTKYLGDTMGPWGANIPSGYVYITTLKKINQIACASSITLSDADLAIINAYKTNITGGQNTTTGAIGSNGTSGTTASTTATTSQEIGSNGTINSNTAAAANTSIFQRFWNFILNLF